MLWLQNTTIICFGYETYTCKLRLRSINSAPTAQLRIEVSWSSLAVGSPYAVLFSPQVLSSEVEIFSNVFALVNDFASI